MVLLSVIFSVEKDPHDTTQKAKESQDTSHKILELQKKLDSARSQVKVVLFYCALQTCSI